MLWHFQLIYLSKAALPVVLLRPILNRPIGLPTVGLLTLTENAVNHNIQFQVILRRLRPMQRPQLCCPSDNAQRHHPECDGKKCNDATVGDCRRRQAKTQDPQRDN